MTAMAYLPLLLFLCVGFTESTVVDLQKRIIRGRPCGPNERLYHVKLTYSNDNLACGGSLVSSEWILTAAHCWEDGQPLHPVFRGQSGQTLTGLTITEHKFYKKREIITKKTHDIMLLKLSTPVTIQPVQLPNCDVRPQVGDSVSIAGNAATTTGPFNTRRPGETADLHCADVNIVDCTQLRNGMKYNIHPDTRQMYKDWKNQHWFCGEDPNPNGADICLGDSGGGVMFNNMIYGVISFTGSREFACSQPAALMDICHTDYKKWIEDTINPPRMGCGPSGLLNCGG